jgi:uncharacterized protein (DUF4415 family)
VLQFFREEGAGWQTRLNEALKVVVSKGAASRR